MADETATLEKVRKLLAKAEAEGVTPPEAEALTAKAAELMAKYGIDQARLNATRPGTDQLANAKITVENPWSDVRIYLLAAIFGAMRCQVVQLNSPRGRAKAWRRSWMLGFVSAVADRVRAAETRATVQADTDDKVAGSTGRSTALVLADRSLAVKDALQQEYPRTRSNRITYSGRGYGQGREAGQRADIGGARVGAGAATAIGR